MIVPAHERAALDWLWGRAPALDAARYPRLAPFLLSLLHGALLASAFAPIGLSFCALVCLLPLLAIAARTANARRSAIFTGLGALPLWLYLHVWLMNVSPVGYPFLAIYLSLYPAIFVLIAAHVFRRLDSAALRSVAVAVVWIGLEALRGSVIFHGYPWYFIAHPMIDVSLIARSASIWGAAGIGLCLAIMQAAFFQLALAKSVRERVGGVLTGVAAAIVLGAGGVAAAPSLNASDSVRVSLLQTNVALGRKITWSRDQKIADFNEFLRLTREAGDSAPRPDLIVWPETMFPGYALNTSALDYARSDGLAVDGIPAAQFADILIETQRALGIPLLIGALARDNPRLITDDTGALALESDGYFNSVFLIDGDQSREQRYDKLHLTPFGEVMPYISAVDWLEELLLMIGAGGMTFDLDAGAAPVVFELSRSDRDPVRIATPICFEATMPALCRRLTYLNRKRTVDLLVAVTNDAWFGDWAGGRERQLQLARWRAIELGIPVARAANTGVSQFIRIDGSFIEAEATDRYPRVFEQGLLTADMAIPPAASGTTYGRLGDIVGWVCLAGAGALCAWMTCTRRQGAPKGLSNDLEERNGE